MNLYDYIFPKDGDEDSGDSDNDSEAYDDSERDINFLDIHQILEEYEVEDETEEPFCITLPPNSRCASHTLNLSLVGCMKQQWENAKHCGI